jgi:hypothetical protein
MLNPEIGKFFSKIGKNREIFCQKSGSLKIEKISKNQQNWLYATNQLYIIQK